jgi:hypothetical protein
MSKLEIPNFQSKKDLYGFLVENKSTLIAQKKSVIKFADGVLYTNPLVGVKDQTVKASEVDITDVNEIKVKAVINSTNWMDSHLDVHLKGLWDKSLRESKDLMHLQEHQMNRFDKIISDGSDLKAYTEQMTWDKLGFNATGTTEALMFESTIKRDRNPYMFNQYAKGYVKNHSVGMRYVKIVMAINDKDYAAEYDAWEKYYSEIINKDFADEMGYFWAVKEAKAIEGSAVPKGSNIMTPTMEVTKDIEPVQTTQSNEAGQPLQEQVKFYSNLI